MDHTLQGIIALFNLANYLHLSLSITEKEIILGTFRYNHLCQRFDEALMPCYGEACAYYAKEIQMAKGENR